MKTTYRKSWAATIFMLYKSIIIVVECWKPIFAMYFCSLYPRGPLNFDFVICFTF